MKTVHLVLACFTSFLLSCNNDKQPVAATDGKAAETEKSSLQAQKNLDAMHVVDKAFQSGDVSGIDSVVAADFIDHTEKGDMNRDSLKSAIRMSAMDKTMKMETTKEVADDDYAFAMMHVTGTGDGVMMAAGPYDMHTIEVVKFSNGKAKEHWSYMSMAEMGKMMQSMMRGMNKMKMGADKKKD